MSQRNFEKSGQNESKLQVKAKEQIALGQEKLYIIVRTEPAALPVKIGIIIHIETVSVRVIMVKLGSNREKQTNCFVEPEIS